MITVGFVGTAKNTGKTTTTLEVLEQASRAGLPTALTSIGYDGENRDNVTGLPKPRFFLQEGMIVATATGCLKACTAGIRIHAHTGIRTALGEIVTGVVSSAGAVLVAGPNRRSDLEILFEHLSNLGARLTLVDGALNRLVPMICTDGLVLSSGAAFNQDIDFLARHAGALAALLQAPVAGSIPAWDGTIRLMAGEETLACVNPGSLLGDAALQLLQNSLRSPATALHFPGACDPIRLEKLLRSHPKFLESAAIFFDNPLKLVASGDPFTWQRVWREFKKLGISPYFKDKNPVFFMTVNPFYPRYLPQTGEYEAAYVNKNALLTAVREKITPHIPVYDIRQPPIPDLLRLVGIKREGEE